MQAIKTMELVKQYKTLTAVDRLYLDIQQGELFSLLGVNGAGKTTTIKMLSCLTKPTSGDILVGGYSTTKEPEQVKRLIGVSPQETAVAPNLSVKENLELICGIHSFSKEKTEAKIRELSGQFALDTVLKRKAGNLSCSRGTVNRHSTQNRRSKFYLTEWVQIVNPGIRSGTYCHL